MSLRSGGWSGTRAAVLPRTREYLRGGGPTAEAQAAFDAGVAALCQDGIRVRLYINPTHAMTQDALYWAGKWDPVERWQRALAAMAARRRQAGCDARVYDFSGYNSITTEPIPQVSLRPQMAHYWEPSHYRGNVGHMILARMFGDPEGLAPDDFGEELLPATMDQHLAALRAGRDRYHREHAAETALVRTIVAEPR